MFADERAMGLLFFFIQLMPGISDANKRFGVKILSYIVEVKVTWSEGGAVTEL